jgi:hypothetical protein
MNKEKQFETCHKHGKFPVEGNEHEHPHNGDTIVLCPVCRECGINRHYGLCSMGGEG